MPKRTVVNLVNTRPDEALQYQKFHTKTTSVNFESIKSLCSNSVLIVEDIVYMNSKEEKILRHCINYDSHHKSIKLFCVSHTIHKTSIFSMLPLFHYIVFTPGASNVPVARFAFNFFKLDKPVIQIWIDEFKKLSGPGSYLIMDCSNLRLYGSQNFLENCYLLHESNGKTGENESSESWEKKLDECERRFDKMLEGHPLKSLAGAAFSLIIRNLNSSVFDVQDFTLKFFSREGDLKKLSLIDYVLCLLTPGDCPTKEVKVVHQFLVSQQKCVLPQYFFKNSLLKPGAERDLFPVA